MIARTLFIAALLVAAPALAKDKSTGEKLAPEAQAYICEGAFAIDSSEARLIEIYGADNVWTGIVPGPEGTEMLATRVFDGDPERQLEFVWWDEENRKDPSYIDLPQSAELPNGLHAGMSVAEVVALNGEPFTMSGFGWDYGGYANIESGSLTQLPGDCVLSLRFSPHDDAAYAGNTNAVSGDVTVPSDEKLLVDLDVRLDYIALGYPHPDFRD